MLQNWTLPTDERSDSSIKVSTWGFCQAVRLALRSPVGDKTQGIRACRRPAYSFSSSIEHQNYPTSLDLPSKSFIGHLAQVVDFHLNTTHFFFDLPTLQEEIELVSVPHASALQRTKFLAIIALGKLFLEKGATSFGPPGIREFLHATQILPPNLVLSQSPQTAIVTLSLLAVYAQAADLHVAAYLYVRIRRTS